MTSHEAPATSEAPQFGPPNVRLEVQNFGPLAQASVELRPLTMFVGPSNTGKTYLSLLIYSLHRMFEGFPPLPPPSILLQSIYDLPHGHQEEIKASEKIEMEMTEEMIGAMIDKWTSDEQVRLSEFPDLYEELISSINDTSLLGDNLSSELQRCFDVDSKADLVNHSWKDNARVSLSISDMNKELWQFTMKWSDKETLISGHIEDIIFPPDYRNSMAQTHTKKLCHKLLQQGRNWREIFAILFQSNFLGHRWFDTVLYLPASRGGIMQSYQLIVSALVSRSTRPGLRFPETIPTLSGSVADFIQHLILYREYSRNFNKISELATVLEEETLWGRVSAIRSTPGSYPEFVYCPQGTKQNIRLNRASSMVSELTPVVLLMRGRLKPGDTLIIEEPEAHLHPAAQTRMAKTLAALVRAGVRVVVTTHSDWLLQEMANLVREGELRQAQAQEGADSEADASAPWLDPKEVGVWLFKNSEDGDGATVQEIPFDRVDGLEPEDYADVAETLYNDSAKLQNQLEETRIQRENANG
ncbi:MAG: AAA family ATPase [Cyanobacteria bacterium MAG IRC3_bin_20]|nr:AAA family ATPase [Cyanobacteria bacterium MAG IRC3_bin_20]